MNPNTAMRNVIFIFCIVSFIGLAGCSEISEDMLTEDTETAANFAAAPAVVQVEHGTILGPPLVVPDDAPTVAIEAVFKREQDRDRYLEGIRNSGNDMLRFRITASEAPKDAGLFSSRFFRPILDTQDR